MYNSLISGHADSDKDMKQFSSLRYDGSHSRSHSDQFLTPVVSRFTSKIYSHMLVSSSYRKLGMQSLIEGQPFHIERLDSNPLLKIERLQ